VGSDGFRVTPEFAEDFKMEEALIFETPVGETIKRRLPLGLTTGFVLLLMSAALAVGLPSYFTSRAVILIEAQEIPQDLVRSLVTSFADQRMQVIAQRVLTNANLTNIIEKYDLYAEERAKDPLETVIEQMREDITMTPVSADVMDPKQGKAVKATIAFELAYENKSASVAQRVASELVSLFLNENLKQRTETSSDTLNFLTSEAEKLRKEVALVETKLAEFKKRNVERLPELATLNLEMRSRTEQQITQLEGQIQSLQQQRVYLESEIAQQKPNTILISDTGERILGPVDRLRVLESEFVPLAARYGANHPDVVSKRKEIDSLREQVGASRPATEIALKLSKTEGEYAEMAKRYSADHPDVRRLSREIEALRSQLAASEITSQKSESRVSSPPDNPAYIQLQARLQATSTDISALSRQKTSLESKLASIEDRITQSPEVEREYRALTRDYETAQAKYQEVLAKRQEAELASNLESNQRGERFTMIEPPAIPEEPSRPNRILIAVLGVILSLGGGFGAGVLAENVDGRVYGRTGVAKILGVAPLAVIPVLETTKSLARKRNQVIGVVGSLLLILALFALAVHFLVRPLDVLFFRALRVIGL
jgi:polysaccharide biosynthesis transport protein